MIILSFFLVSCSDNSKPENTNKQVKIDRSSPQKVLEESYKFETDMNSKLLTECFYKLKIDVSVLMLKIKNFNVKNISLVKIVKIEQNANFAIASCEYNTYFSGIKDPRQDVEVVKFIKDNEGWHILNNIGDVGDISKEDNSWIASTETNQKNFIWTNEATRKVMDSQLIFDETNKAFMDTGSSKQEQALQKK